MRGWLSRQSLEGSINGHKKLRLTPTDAVITAIIELIQPYMSGKLGLYGLHTLDITDKHHVLIPTVQEIAANRIDILNQHGQPVGTIKGLHITLHKDNKTGSFVKLDPPFGAVLHGDPKAAFDITFAKGQPFEGESILKAMKSLKTNVIEALNVLLRSA